MIVAEVTFFNNPIWIGVMALLLIVALLVVGYQGRKR